MNTPAVTRLFQDTSIGQMHLRMSLPTKAEHRPLVCLHMSPQSSSSFKTIMPMLAQRRIVVAPDYHGFGESDPPPPSPAVTIEDYACTIWETLTALDLDQVDLIGHHTGSKVAAEMANQQPEKVGSIVMLSASMMSAAEFTKTETDRNFSATPMDRQGTRVTELWTTLSNYCPPDVPLETLYRFVTDIMRCGETYMWGARAAYLYNEKFLDVLKTLNHPITVVNPGDDLFEITPKIMPYLAKGQLINQPDWNVGFLETKAKEASDLILSALMAMESGALVGEAAE